MYFNKVTMDDVELHILPCLIKYEGKTDFKKRFKDKIRKVPEQNSDDTSIPGGYDIKEVCGNATESVNFSVKITEKYLRDLYYPHKGIDKLLKDKYYVFFRGRQLRGSELSLDQMGYKTVIVTPDKPPRSSNLTKSETVESKGLKKTYNVSPFILWELEQDVSPLSPNLSAYRYLILSKPLSNYNGEEEYIKKFNSTV